MDKDQKVVRIELPEVLPDEPQTDGKPAASELKVDELELRITPKTVGIFF